MPKEYSKELKSVPYYAKHLKEAKSLNSASRTLSALEQIGSKGAAKAIIEYGMKHENKNIRHESYINLLKFCAIYPKIRMATEAILEEGITSNNEYVKEKTPGILQRLAIRQSDDAKEYGLTPRAEEHVKSYKLSEKFIDALHKNLDHDNSTISLMSAWALGLTRSKKALPILMKYTGAEKKLSTQAKGSIKFIQDSLKKNHTESIEHDEGEWRVEDA